MGRSIPVRLGRFRFGSKKEAKEALRSTRDAHQQGAPILDDDAVDLLLGVVAAHPQSVEKVGAGIAGFYVGRAPEFNTRCFYVRRVDGSTTDISWNEALTPTKPIVRLRMACRNAIEDQKRAFRDADWPVGDKGSRVCPVTGEPFSRGEAHVDHIPPKTLKRLVDEWLSAEGLDLDSVLINDTGDMKAVDTFSDPAQLSSWRDFHQASAQLRLISAAGNLRQGAQLLDLDPANEA